MNLPEAQEQLIEKIEPKPLDDLTTQDPKKGAIYLCMECGEDFEEGKNARGHACQEEHRQWIRHSKLPNGWKSPYKKIADDEIGEFSA